MVLNRINLWIEVRSLFEISVTWKIIKYFNFFNKRNHFLPSNWFLLKTKYFITTYIQLFERFFPRLLKVLLDWLLFAHHVFKVLKFSALCIPRGSLNFFLALDKSSMGDEIKREIFYGHFYFLHLWMVLTKTFLYEENTIIDRTQAERQQVICKN